uniref:Peptidylprolyl isomerase n=1 Tax=Oryza brachyantha TaxID=4533 RepID=J3LP12_ORYBR
MVMLRRGLICAVSLLALVLILLQLGIISAVGCCSCSSFCCGDDDDCHQQQQHHGGDVRPGRRLLIGHHQVVIGKALVEHAKGGGDVFDEEEREVLTGPNPLHNR